MASHSLIARLASFRRPFPACYCFNNGAIFLVHEKKRWNRPPQNSASGSRAATPQLNTCASVFEPLGPAIFRKGLLNPIRFFIAISVMSISKGPALTIWTSPSTNLGTAARALVKLWFVDIRCNFHYLLVSKPKCRLNLQPHTSASARTSATVPAICCWHFVG